MRCVPVAALTFVPLLLGLPSAAGLLVGSHEFTTALAAVTLNEDENQSGESGGLPANLTILSGRASWSATGGGFGFSNISAMAGTALDRMEAYNYTELNVAVSERRLPQGGAFAQFQDARFDVIPGSTVILLAHDEPIGYGCQAPFLLGLPVVLPPEVFGEESQELAQGAFFLGAGYDQECALEQTANTTGTFLIMGNGGSGVTITAADGTQASYVGTDWVFRVYGQPSYAASAQGILAPFSENASATLRTYGGSDLPERFDLNLLMDLFRSFAPQEEGSEAGGDPTQGLLPPEVVSAVESMAPVLDGVIFGNLGNETSVDGAAFTGPGFAFIRFSALELSAMENSTSMSLEGSSRFILVDGNLYATQSSTTVGPITIPVLSYFLWIVAIGAIVAGFVIKPFVGAEQIKVFGLIRLIGFAFHMLAIVASFLLWDLEFQALLGTSLLKMFFSQGTGNPAALGIVAAFQLIPYSMAWLFFGMPLRFITNSALKLGGIKKARGLGKGVGNLAQWGIGAAFIPLMLQGFVAGVLDALAGAGFG